MRVIAGIHKSRRLQAPHGLDTRPSSDRLRETLFNILGERVRGSVFLDAYAGTGAVGIEALSRGARRVVWVENAAPALRALRANLQALGITAGPGMVIERPLRTALAALDRFERSFPAAPGRFDFVFLDPPYADARELEQALAALDRHPGLLRPDSVVIAETRRGTKLPAPMGRLYLRDTHPSGDSQLAFFAINEP